MQTQLLEELKSITPPVYVTAVHCAQSSAHVREKAAFPDPRAESSPSMVYAPKAAVVARSPEAGRRVAGTP